jgi:cell division cycle protein 20 (cofactor of APC complex)
MISFFFSLLIFFKVDRFIPSRNELDIDLSMYKMINLEKGKIQNIDLLKENYKITIGRSIFNGKLENSRCLNFTSNMIQKQENDLYQMKLLSEELKIRKIKSNTEKILDAPDLVDDYYLNILDWSSKNLVGIGLNNSVYLWNPDNSSINQVTKLPETNIICSISFSKDGNYLAIGTSNAELQIWDLEKSKMVNNNFDFFFSLLLMILID